ncbi:L1 [Peromyscus papillomavirus 1]|uniref:Major capsid protein L1 n=1 Tax=Peromyscus papillomavirus 1 TaxID=1074206 RepID=G1C9I8_9PAPI|nr:L1 [Peromyscus papillomavirus 1]AEM05821.1 L1 [Peromyscus papillomavirus 1]
MSAFLFQMAFWLPNNQKLYLPPTPVTRILSTDEFVTRTSIYYHASSDRLLTVGNPYYPVKDGDTVTVPKVSPHQYRVFRVRLPDPNRFAFADTSVYDPDQERLVWGLRGVEISRGQPLGIGVTGHPLFNKYEDVENPNKYSPTPGTDNRQNVGFDPKQSQLFILGCTPALGEHWNKTLPCAGVGVKAGDCPPIERLGTVIEDGDMIDIGYGNLDFRYLQENKSEVPLDIVDSICKYPDYLGMTKDTYGNSCFFYARREQIYSRHFFSRAGVQGEQIPDTLYFKGAAGQGQENTALATYGITPSGSLVSSDAILFNRPYWLERAQGQNNGILWNNQLFVTVVDNTRGTNFTINVQQTKEDTYKAGNFKQYSRHVEEYELEFVFQLCKVRLTTEVLAHLHNMVASVLDNWNLNVGPPTSGSLSDRYRFIESLATKCPDKVVEEKKDPYDGLIFWNVDLSEKLTDDLDQFSLGRKFLYQHALGRAPAAVRSRKRAASPNRRSKTVAKRKR